jgi:hypothetical protein
MIRSILGQKMPKVPVTGLQQLGQVGEIFVFDRCSYCHFSSNQTLSTLISVQKAQHVKTVLSLIKTGHEYEIPILNTKVNSYT